ncbi:hypothetical protein N9D31_00570 [Oligoflexaceae bacterium]|nr:hypothetical protein [Oligoflexaceae bacterium]
MKNSRLKMTLLELLDASPRLQKRLASMSLSSGKPIFHLDLDNDKEMKEAKAQFLPGIFFVKNLLNADRKKLKDLSDRGRIISFMKLDPIVKESLDERAMTEALENVDCCVLFSNIAPLVNRIILATLSQAMANISFSTSPNDFLYWGSWKKNWNKDNDKPTVEQFFDEVCENLKLNPEFKKEIGQIFKIKESTNKNAKCLKAKTIEMGCDGTIFVSKATFELGGEPKKSMLNIQKYLMQFSNRYLAIDISKIKEGELTITQFTPLTAQQDDKNYRLMIILNSPHDLADIFTESRAG